MAGSAKDTFEEDLLQHIFENAVLANIGSDLPAAVTPGSLYVALYSVAPTDSTQGTELTYTGYARVGIARSGAGFDAVGGNVANAAAVTFGEMSAGGPQTAVAFAYCEADVETTDDQIIWGDITSPGGGLVINNGVIPEFQAGELDVNLD